MRTLYTTKHFKIPAPAPSFSVSTGGSRHGQKAVGKTIAPSIGKPLSQPAYLGQISKYLPHWYRAAFAYTTGADNRLKTGCGSSPCPILSLASFRLWANKGEKEQR